MTGDDTSGAGGAAQGPSSPGGHSGDTHLSTDMHLRHGDGARDRTGEGHRRSLNSSATLTRESLEAAFRQVQEEEHHGRRQDADRAHAFIESIPEGLRSHEFIVRLALAIGSGAIFHPKDARDIDAHVKRLVAEHEAQQRGEHPSGLWVPPSTLGA